MRKLPNVSLSKLDPFYLPALLLFSSNDSLSPILMSCSLLTLVESLVDRLFNVHAIASFFVGLDPRGFFLFCIIFRELNYGLVSCRLALMYLVMVRFDSRLVLLSRISYKLSMNMPQPGDFYKNYWIVLIVKNTCAIHSNFIIIDISSHVIQISWQDRAQGLGHRIRQLAQLQWR